MPSVAIDGGDGGGGDGMVEKESPRSVKRSQKWRNNTRLNNTRLNTQSHQISQVAQQNNTLFFCIFSSWFFAEF
jgi:hypothetical protein